MFVHKLKCEALPQLELLPKEEIIIGEEANASLRGSSVIPPSLNSVCKDVISRAKAALEFWVFPAPFLFPILCFSSVIQGRALKLCLGGGVSPVVSGDQVCAVSGVGTEHLQRFANPVCVVSLPCPRYFSLQATHPLGFDDSVRLEIESNICREGGPLPNCFTTPLRQAWTTMETVRSSFRVGWGWSPSEWGPHSGRVMGGSTVCPALSCSFADFLFTWRIEQLQENLFQRLFPSLIWRYHPLAAVNALFVSLGDYCSLMEVTEFPPMWIAINSLFCIFRKFLFLLVGVVCKSNTNAVVNNVTLGFPDTRNERFDSGAAENCAQWNRITVKLVGLSGLSF